MNMAQELVGSPLPKRSKEPRPANRDLKSRQRAVILLCRQLDNRPYAIRRITFYIEQKQQVGVPKKQHFRFSI